MERHILLRRRAFNWQDASEQQGIVTGTEVTNIRPHPSHRAIVSPPSSSGLNCRVTSASLSSLRTTRATLGAAADAPLVKISLPALAACVAARFASSSRSE